MAMMSGTSQPSRMWLAMLGSCDIHYLNRVTNSTSQLTQTATKHAHSHASGQVLLSIYHLIAAVVEPAVTPLVKVDEVAAVAESGRGPAPSAAIWA